MFQRASLHPSDFREAGLLPKNVLSPASMRLNMTLGFVVSRRSGATPSLVFVGVTVPHHWYQ